PSRSEGLSSSWNARTTGEAISAALTPGEAERFEAALRPLVDRGQGMKRSAFAYLRAVKSSENLNGRSTAGPAEPRAEQGRIGSLSHERSRAFPNVRGPA